LKGAVDLRQQKEEYELERVFTKDGIPLGVKVTALYRIIQGEGILVRQARYEPSTPAVVKALFSTQDWKTQTELLVKTKVRDTIARFDLEPLLGLVKPGEIPLEELQSLRRETDIPWQLVPRVPLQEELRGKADDEARHWGVEVLKVTLDEIRLPDDAREHLLAAWGVRWTEVVKSREADIEAHAAQKRAEGEREAARIRAEAIEITAEAEARAVQLKGEATAQAQAEIYRQKLAALQPLGRALKEEDVLYLVRALILDDVESLEQRLKAPANSASGEKRA
jgi:regulator of protease activity HflC (stomatin/prohibitin superfamily)